MVKTPLGTATSDNTVPQFDSWLHLQFQVPVHVHSGRQQVVPEVAAYMPAICLRDTDGVPGFWLQATPGPAITGFYGKKLVNGLSLSLPCTRK